MNRRILLSPNGWDEERFRTSEDQFLLKPAGAHQTTASDRVRHLHSGSTAGLLGEESLGKLPKFGAIRRKFTN